MVVCLDEGHLGNPGPDLPPLPSSSSPDLHLRRRLRQLRHLRRQVGHGHAGARGQGRGRATAGGGGKERERISGVATLHFGRRRRSCGKVAKDLLLNQRKNVSVSRKKKGEIPLARTLTRHLPDGTFCTFFFPDRRRRQQQLIKNSPVGDCATCASREKTSIKKKKKKVPSGSCCCCNRPGDVAHHRLRLPGRHHDRRPRPHRRTLRGEHHALGGFPGVATLHVNRRKSLSQGNTHTHTHKSVRQIYQHVFLNRQKMSS